MSTAFAEKPISIALARHTAKIAVLNAIGTANPRFSKLIRPLDQGILSGRERRLRADPARSFTCCACSLWVRLIGCSISPHLQRPSYLLSLLKLRSHTGKTVAAKHFDALSVGVLLNLY
jgi:hypothetical protein